MLYYQGHVQSDGRQGFILFYLYPGCKHIFGWYTDLEDLKRAYPDATLG